MDLCNVCLITAGVLIQCYSSGAIVVVRPFLISMSSYTLCEYSIKSIHLLHGTKTST